jgi:hypothetical protein
MTINELLVIEIKAKSELAKKAIELYVEYGYTINFTNLNIPESGGNGVRVELILNNEIATNSWCQTIGDMVTFFESKLSIIE